jgi:hypothetical protein
MKGLSPKRLDIVLFKIDIINHRASNVRLLEKYIFLGVNHKELVTLFSEPFSSLLKIV